MAQDPKSPLTGINLEAFRRAREEERIGVAPTISRGNVLSSTVEIPEYDDYFGADVGVTAPIESLQKVRAERQSGLEQFGAFLNQAVVGEIVGGTIEGIGYLFDVEDMWNTLQGDNQEWGNWFSDIGKDLKTWTREATPIYEEEPGKFNPGDFAWWMSNGTSVASTLSLMIPAAGATRLAGAAGKGLGLARGLSKLGMAEETIRKLGYGATVLNQALASRHMENMMEASQVFEEKVADYRNLGYSEDKAKEFAGKAASATYVRDFAMLGTDVLQYALMSRIPKGKIKGSISNKVADAVTSRGGNAIRALGRMAKKAPGHILNVAGEGLEEAYQFIAAEEGKYLADVEAGVVEDDKDFGSRLGEYLKEDELATSALFGALGGAVFGGARSLITKHKDIYDRQRRITHLNKRKNEALELGDAATALQIDNYITEEIGTQAAIYGKTENAIKTFEALRDSEKVDPEFRSTIDQRIEDIKNIETIYNKNLNLPDISQNEAIRLTKNEFLESKYTQQLSDLEINKTSLENDIKAIGTLSPVGEEIFQARKNQRVYDQLVKIYETRLGKKNAKQRSIPKNLIPLYEEALNEAQRLSETYKNKEEEARKKERTSEEKKEDSRIFKKLDLTNELIQVESKAQLLKTEIDKLLTEKENLVDPEKREKTRKETEKRLRKKERKILDEQKKAQQAELDKENLSLIEESNDPDFIRENLSPDVSKEVKDMAIKKIQRIEDDRRINQEMDLIKKSLVEDPERAVKDVRQIVRDKFTQFDSETRGEGEIKSDEEVQSEVTQSITELLNETPNVSPEVLNEVFSEVNSVSQEITDSKKKHPLKGQQEKNEVPDTDLLKMEQQLREEEIPDITESPLEQVEPPESEITKDELASYADSLSDTEQEVIIGSEQITQEKLKEEQEESRTVSDVYIYNTPNQYKRDKAGAFYSLDESGTVSPNRRQDTTPDGTIIEEKAWLLANPEIAEDSEFSFEIVENTYWQGIKNEEDIVTWEKIPIAIKYKEDIVGWLHRHNPEKQKGNIRKDIYEALKAGKKVTAPLNKKVFSYKKSIDRGYEYPSNINNIIIDRQIFFKGLDSSLGTGYYKDKEGNIQFSENKPVTLAIVVGTPHSEEADVRIEIPDGENVIAQMEQVKQISQLKGRDHRGNIFSIELLPSGEYGVVKLHTANLSNAAIDRTYQLLSEGNIDAIGDIVFTQSPEEERGVHSLYLSIEKIKDIIYVNYHSPRLNKLVSVTLPDLQAALAGDLDSIKYREWKDGKYVSTDKLLADPQLDLRAFLLAKKYSVQLAKLNDRATPYTSPVPNVNGEFITYDNYYEYLTSEQEQLDFPSGIHPNSTIAILTSDVYNDNGSLFNDVGLQFTEFNIEGKVTPEKRAVQNDNVEDITKDSIPPEGKRKTPRIKDRTLRGRKKEALSTLLPATEDIIEEDAKAKPLEPMDSPLSIAEFVTLNRLDKVDVARRRRGDLTYKFLYDLANEFDITINPNILGRSQLLESTELDLNTLAYYDEGSNSIGFTYRFDRLSDINKARILAHEVLHGVVTKRLQVIPDSQRETFNNSIDTFIEELKSDRFKDVYIVQEVLKAVETGGRQELISYAFTNPEFASELDSIVIEGERGEKKTFWTKLKELILSIISDDRTKLDELNEIMDTYLAITPTAFRVGGKTAEQINIENAKKWIDKKFSGKVATEVFNTKKNVGTATAHGYFSNGIVHLWNQAEVGTEYHEAFHAAFRLFLNEEQQQEILNEASEKYKIDRTRQRLPEVNVKNVSREDNFFTYDVTFENNKAGTLSYIITTNNIEVTNIEINEKYQGKGVATEVYKQLQEAYPDKTLQSHVTLKEEGKRIWTSLIKQGYAEVFRATETSDGITRDVTKYKIIDKKFSDNSLKLEEKLAEEFRDYVLTQGTVIKDAGLFRKIAKFFRDLYNYIKTYFSNKRDIDQLYSLIESGKLGRKKFRRKMDNMTPQIAYSLMDGYTEDQVKTVVDTIYTKVQESTQDLERNNKAFTKDFLLEQVRDWFLQNAWSQNNQPIDIDIAKTLNNLLNEAEASEDTGEVERLYAQYARILVSNNIDELSTKGVDEQDRQSNVNYFSNIYNRWETQLDELGNVIEYGWDKLLERKMNSVGVEIADLIIIDEDTPIEKIYNLSHFLESSKDKLSVDLKLFLHNIESEGYNFLGFKSYLPFDELYSNLAVALVANNTGGYNTRDYKSMKQVLSNLGEFKPMFKTLVDKLEEREKIEPRIAALFYNSFRQIYNNFLTIKEEFERKGDKWEVQYKMFDSNRQGLQRRLRTLWRDNSREKDIKNDRALYKLEEGKLNIKEPTKVIDLIFSYNKLVEPFEGDKVPDSYIKELSSFLGDIGIDITPDSISKFLSTGITSKGEILKNRDLYWLYLIRPSKFNNNAGIEEIIKAIAKVTIDVSKRTYKAESYEGIRENPDDIYEKQITNRVVNRFVDLESNFNTDLFLSFINSMNKSIFPVNLPTALTNKLVEVQRGDIAVNEGYLRDEVFVPRDERGKVLNQYKSVYMKLADSLEFRANFTWQDFEAIKRKREDIASADQESLTEVLTYIARYNMFLNNGNRTYSKMVIPTMGDRRRMITINVPRRESFTNFGLSSTEASIQNIIRSYLEQDIRRMLRSYEEIRSIEEGGLPDENLIPNYHYQEFKRINGKKVRNKNKRDGSGTAFKFSQIYGTADFYVGKLGQEYTILEAVKDRKVYNALNKDILNESINNEVSSIVERLETYVDSQYNKLLELQIISNKLTPDGNIVFQTFSGRNAKTLNTVDHKLDPKGFRLYLVGKDNSIGNAETVFKDMIRSFVYNDLITRNEISKLTRIDRSFTKNYTDFNKRFSNITTPGLEPIIQGQIDENEEYGMKESFMEATIFDIFNTTQSEEIVNSLVDMLEAQNADKKLISIVKKAYKPGASNKTDAFGVLTLDFGRNIMQGFGMWTDKHEEAYKNYNEGKGFIDNNENAVTIPPLKTYLDGQYYQNGKMVSVMIKNSYQILIKDYTKDYPQLDKLLDTMLSEGIDAVNTDSTRKLERHGMADITQEEYKLVGSKLNGKDLRLPQIIPDKKESPLWGSQIRKLIMANLQRDLNYTVNDGVANTNTFTGDQLFELYNNLGKALLEKSLEELQNELGYSQYKTLSQAVNRYSSEEEKQSLREAKLRFLRNLREVLRRENENRDLPDSYNKVLDIIASTETDEWQYRVPLAFPVYQRKFEQIIFSLYRNNVLNQRINGTSAVQIAELGGHGVDGDLKFVRSKGDKILHAEVAIKMEIAEKLNLVPGKKLIDIPEETRRLVGYRIPYQGKNSSLPMIVKYILPDNYDHAILVPGEITTQMGSDFDIDKLFLMMPNLNEKNLKIRFNYQNLEYSDIKSQSRESIENAITDITEAVLRNPAHLEEMIRPLDDDIIDKQIEYLQSRLPELSAEIDFTDPNSEIELELRNKVGTAGRGVYSNFLSGHAISQHADISINDPYIPRIDGKEYGNLKITRDRKGGLIADNFSRHLTASVDNAKDPKMGFTNDNMFTMPVTGYLLNAGLEDDVVTWFRNQPIILELTERYHNEGRTPGQVLDLIVDLGKSYTPGFYIQEDVENLNTIELKEYIGNIVPRGEGVYFENQLVILSNFWHFYRGGRMLMKLNSLIMSDRISDMSTFSAIEVFEDNEKLVLDKQDIFVGVEDIIKGDAYELSKAYRDSIQAAMDFASISDLFPFKAKAIVDMKDNLKLALQKDNLTKLHHDRLNQSIFLWMFQQADSPIQNFFTEESFNRLMINPDTNIAAELTKLTNKYPGLLDAEYGNEFIKKLMPHPDNKKEETIVHRVKFENSYSYSKYERDLFTGGFYELLYEPELYTENTQAQKEMSKFGRDLVNYLLLSTGFTPGSDSFIDMLPVEFWEEQIGDTNLVDYFRTQLKRLEEPDYFNKFTEFFIKNNVELSQFLPAVKAKSKQKGGMRRITFEKTDNSVYDKLTESYKQYVRIWNPIDRIYELYKYNEITSSGQIEYVIQEKRGLPNVFAEYIMYDDIGNVIETSLYPTNTLDVVDKTIEVEGNGFGSQPLVGKELGSKISTGKFKGYQGGFSNEGKGTPKGDGKDKAMRKIADGFIGEIVSKKFGNNHVWNETSSTYTSYEEISEKGNFELTFPKNLKDYTRSGLLYTIPKEPKIIMLARNSELGNRPLDEYTKFAIKESSKEGAEFVVGDMPGVDGQFINYLQEIGADFTVYHTGSTPRIIVEEIESRTEIDIENDSIGTLREFMKSLPTAEQREILRQEVLRLRNVDIKCD